MWTEDRVPGSGRGYGRLHPSSCSLVPFCLPEKAMVPIGAAPPAQVLPLDESEKYIFVSPRDYLSGCLLQ